MPLRQDTEGSSGSRITRTTLAFAIAIFGVRVRTREKDGAQGRNRTSDTAIFSRMLYQLSYLGTARQRDRALIDKAVLAVHRKNAPVSTPGAKPRSPGSCPSTWCRS